MSGYVWLAFWLGYFAMSVMYARHLVYKWAHDPDSTSYQGEGRHVDNADRAEVAMGALGCGLIWPIVMGFLKGRDWLFKPVDQNRERVERLKADREAWLSKRYSAQTEDERRMADDIVKTLDDILARQ